jgi:3-hydroxyisobutyrate dehydrogenase-like beta-hydroxyacid dehydrogenase
MQVGFIGLGPMGKAMAARILPVAIGAGGRLAVFNRTSAKADPLVGAGAIRAASASEAARSDVVFTMVADDAAIENHVFGKNGILEALPKGALHVCSSSISAEMSKRLAQSHAQRGQRYLAAPVVGRPDAAQAGKLLMLVGGAQDAIATAQPLLQTMADRIDIISSDPSHAHLIKLTVNFMVSCVIESVAEVFALTEKAGIPVETTLDLICNRIFPTPLYKIVAGIIAAGRYDNAGASVPLGMKDNRALLQAGEQMGVPMPFASVVRDRMVALIGRGEAHLDWFAIAKQARREAGLAD